MSLNIFVWIFSIIKFSHHNNSLLHHINLLFLLVWNLKWILWMHLISYELLISMNLNTKRVQRSRVELNDDGITTPPSHNLAIVSSRGTSTSWVIMVQFHLNPCRKCKNSCWRAGEPNQFVWKNWDKMQKI